MTRNWQFEPLLHRIFAFGELLRFKTLELYDRPTNNTRSVLVSHHPFFKSREARLVESWEWDKFTWNEGSEYRNYSGTVLVEGGGADENVKQSRVSGWYKMQGNPFGQVHVGSVPTFLTETSENMFTGGEVRALTGLRGEVLNRLAKLMTWELNFKKRSCRFECPYLRADISPLTAIRLDFPRTTLPSGESFSDFAGAIGDVGVLGCVDSVDIIIDAGSSYARTIFQLGHVRSFTQQRDMIEPGLDINGWHPFFKQNFVGARIDTGAPRSGYRI